MAIKVVGQNSGAFVEVETKTLAMRSVVRPLDVIEGFGGAYSSGTGTTAPLNEPATIKYMYSLMNFGPTITILRKAILSCGIAAQSTSSNSGQFQLFVMRGPNDLAIGSSWTFQSGVASKLRSRMPDPNSQLLVGGGAAGVPYLGTIIDPLPIASVNYSYPGISGAPALAPTDLLDGLSMPVILYPWQGVILGLIAAAAGTVTLWSNVTFSWEERDEF